MLNYFLYKFFTICKHLTTLLFRYYKGMTVVAYLSLFKCPIEFLAHLLGEDTCFDEVLSKRRDYTCVR